MLNPASNKSSKTLKGSEMATILVFDHYSGYKNFTYYYDDFIRAEGKQYFPKAPQYHIFLLYIFGYLRFYSCG